MDVFPRAGAASTAERYDGLAMCNYDDCGRFDILTPLMLRLLSSIEKDAQTVEKHLNLVMLLFTGYISLSTHMPGFQSFYQVLCVFCIGQIKG